MNKNLEKISGYSTEAIQKMNPLDFFDTEDKKIVADKIQEVLDKGQSSVEASILSKSGKKIPFFLSGLKMSIEDQSYLLGMGIDITEKKKES